MSQAKTIPDAFLTRGRSLSDLGIDEYAFDKRTSFELLNALDNGQAILGGDVYSETSSGIESAYANWSCEKNKCETPSEFTRRSLAEARAYIERYREPDEKRTLYVLVIGEAAIF